MEMAIEFAWSGELMDFAIHNILEGHPTPPVYQFVSGKVSIN